MVPVLGTVEVEDGAVGVDMLPLWVGATVVVMVALPVVLLLEAVVTTGVGEAVTGGVGVAEAVEVGAVVG